jgi:hypothetical protein
VLAGCKASARICVLRSVCFGWFTKRSLQSPSSVVERLLVDGLSVSMLPSWLLLEKSFDCLAMTE